MRQWQITLGKGPQTVAFQWHPHSVVFKDKREKPLEKKVYSLLPRMTNAQNHKTNIVRQLTAWWTTPCTSSTSNAQNSAPAKLGKLLMKITWQTANTKGSNRSATTSVKQATISTWKDRGFSSSTMTGVGGKQHWTSFVSNTCGHDMAVGTRWNEWKAQTLNCSRLCFQTIFYSFSKGRIPVQTRAILKSLLPIRLYILSAQTGTSPTHFPVQFKMVSMHLENPICALSHLSEVSPTLPLIQFQCSADWGWPSFVLSREIAFTLLYCDWWLPVYDSVCAALPGHVHSYITECYLSFDLWSLWLFTVSVILHKYILGVFHKHLHFKINMLVERIKRIIMSKFLAD